MFVLCHGSSFCISYPKLLRAISQETNQRPLSLCCAPRVLALKFPLRMKEQYLMPLQENLCLLCQISNQDTLKTLHDQKGCQSLCDKTSLRCCFKAKMVFPGHKHFSTRQRSKSRFAVSMHIQKHLPCLA